MDANAKYEYERIERYQLKLDAIRCGDLVYDVYHISNAATITIGDIFNKVLIGTFRSSEFLVMHEFIIDYLNRIYSDGWKRDFKATGMHGSLYRLTNHNHPIIVDDRIRRVGEIISYGITIPAE